MTNDRDAGRRRRGTLRVYLGAAPGVGKTYAMLGEGRRARDRGVDVVVGFVETHGRRHTADQIGDLEVVPRARIEYRGAVFEEMDVDAVLARRPERALVDELAHTNVPGSRNQKRWQDIAPRSRGWLMQRVLVVADEPSILRALAVNLRARDYQVDLAATGEEALALAARHRPDAVILDLGLPGMSGSEVIAGLRGWTKVPIVILSAREDQAEKVAALDAGADDYVTKPFGMDELLARLRAALRRATPGHQAAAEVTTADFVVDLVAKKVTTVTGDEVRLTPTEWSLVEVLVGNAGKMVTARQLLQEVWGPQYGEETNYLRVHFAHIRRKLEPDPSRPRYFITEPGMGYRFENRG